MKTTEYVLTRDCPICGTPYKWAYGVVFHKDTTHIRLKTEMKTRSKGWEDLFSSVHPRLREPLSQFVDSGG